LSQAEQKVKILIEQNGQVTSQDFDTGPVGDA
jgi:hypothetical protein